MNTWEKMMNAIRSNLNALIDKSEDPQKMLDQAILDIKEKEAKVRQLLISAMAELKLSKKINDLKKTAENEKTVEILIKGLKALEQKIISLKNETAQKIINKTDSFATYERMEEKIINLEAQNEALNELLSTPKTKKEDPNKDIEELEKELEKLKDK